MGTWLSLMSGFTHLILMSSQAQTARSSGTHPIVAAFLEPLRNQQETNGWNQVQIRHSGNLGMVKEHPPPVDLPTEISEYIPRVRLQKISHANSPPLDAIPVSKNSVQKDLGLCFVLWIVCSLDIPFHTFPIRSFTYISTWNSWLCTFNSYNTNTNSSTWDEYACWKHVCLSNNSIYIYIYIYTYIYIHI